MSESPKRRWMEHLNDYGDDLRPVTDADVLREAARLLESTRRWPVDPPTAQRLSAANACRELAMGLVGENED